MNTKGKLYLGYKAFPSENDKNDLIYTGYCICRGDTEVDVVKFYEKAIGIAFFDKTSIKVEGELFRYVGRDQKNNVYFVPMPKRCQKDEAVFIILRNPNHIEGE